MRLITIFFVLFFSACSLGNKNRIPDIVTHDETAQAPNIDCKPYPKPDPIIIPDITPVSLKEGWLFSHEDYKATSDLTNYIIKYQKQTRAIARHFVECEFEFNRKIDELNRKSGKLD